jgi:flavodoxin
VPFALFSQFYSSCSLALASFSSSLSFGLKDAFSPFLMKKMSQDKKVVVDTKLTKEEKLFQEKKTVDPYIAGFVESMAKTNTEKITNEILEGLSEDTGDIDSYDVESGDEDSEDRPWRPSHSIFGKSTIKQSHLENMRGMYFWDMSIVRAGGDNNVPAPEENEVVIF